MSSYGIKKSITGAALVATLYTAPAIAKEKPKLNLGFNALETALTQIGDVRSRLYTNLSLTIGDAYLGFHGMNETNNLFKGYYFGRQTLIAGKKDSGTKGIVVIKIDKQGIFDKKIGIRNTSLVEKLGGYGFIDLTADKDSANITAFYGKPIAKGTTFEILQAAELPFKGKPGYYTEALINKDVYKKLYAFCRAEMIDFDPEKVTIMGGLAVKF